MTSATFADSAAHSRLPPPICSLAWMASSPNRWARSNHRGHRCHAIDKLSWIWGLPSEPIAISFDLADRHVSRLFYALFVCFPQGDVDEVVLVGGSTRIPKIVELIKQYFNVRQTEIQGTGRRVRLKMIKRNRGFRQPPQSNPDLVEATHSLCSQTHSCFLFR